MTYVPPIAAAICLTTGLMAASAAAQEFYAGKQITMKIGRAHV